MSHHVCVFLAASRWSPAARTSRTAKRPNSSRPIYFQRLWDVFVALTAITG